MRALLVIDIQNDFCPGGALAVAEGDLVVAKANILMAQYDLVVATQDWHPSDHGSFSSSHPGKKPYDMGELGGMPQVMWPAHCVQGTPGASFHSALDVARFDHVSRKGTDRGIDSYSGFFDNGHKKQTDLHAYLNDQHVTEVDIIGLATDYCVKFTALDAVALHLKTRVLSDACRGVNVKPGDVSSALREMSERGVTVV